MTSLRFRRPKSPPRRAFLAAAASCALLPIAAQAEPALLAPLAVPIAPTPGSIGAAPDAVREDAARCLTLAVAYEAGNQPRAGQEAVAEVVLNRLAHPSFPKSVCGVVWQGWRRGTGCQFTFVCDGALTRRLDDRTIRAARMVAQAALGGTAPRRVAGALNYHATYVQPGWAAALDPVGRIGAHVFYRPLAGGQAEGAAIAGQAAAWEEPDHSVIARAWARYRGVDEGPSAAPLLPPPASTQPAPRPFAPWGLPLRP
ncbi:cell wall hydrolase [Novosphingobium sp.]|uniref:cell wall hydrolase n=1 Tax=Novosphingobium sp. TaxID=1874826 RepID=UPI002637DE5B|nr:cell wall hydrolase [Novosphingobium sp.]